MGRTCETSRTCTGACGSRTCMFHEPFQEARGQRPVREARTHVGLRATRAGERETRSGGRDAQGSAALGRKTDPMGRRELLTDTEAHGDRGSRPIGPTSSESKERPDGPTWLCPAGRCLRSSRGLSFPPPATHRRVSRATGELRVGASHATLLERLLVCSDRRSGKTGPLLCPPGDWTRTSQSPPTATSRELYPGFKLSVWAKAALPLRPRECFTGS